MGCLDVHVLKEGAAFKHNSLLANAGELVFVDHADRWDILPDPIKIVTA